MMDVSLEDLRYFLEVAQTQNISRAAERLGVGQSTVSQAVKRLEGALGTQLLDRYKTGARLTQAGSRLFRSGRGALETWINLKEKVLAPTRQIAGQYTIGCHPAAGFHFLPAFLQKLLAGHPDLTIRLFHGLSRDIVLAVLDFKVDFGIVINPVKHSDFVIKKIAVEKIGFWASPNSLVGTLLYNPDLHETYELLAKAKNLPFSRHIESTNLNLIASLTEAGCGVSILPERIARRCKKLKPFDSSLPIVKSDMCLIYRADRKMSVAARYIIDTIRQANLST